MPEPQPSILITGASGFVGSHLVEVALKAGYEVWAAVRKSSSRQYLADSRIHIIELNLNDATQLHTQIATFIKEHPTGWEYVVHAAGATKARNEEAFMQANYEATRNLVEALRSLHVVPRRLVFVSSLSAVPMANGFPAGNQAETAYGRSKLKAEAWLLAQSDIHTIILRPTGVYGPRERDYFLMVKSIKSHVDLSVGLSTQYLTFIYVADLCEAILAALIMGNHGAIYQLSDGQTSTNRDFSLLLQSELDIKHIVRLAVPLWLTKAVCYVGEWMATLTKSMTALNRDKYHILKQRDWRCDITAAQRELDFNPRYDLASGMRETIAWYKDHGWL